tara:strand:- start:1854 stop:2054 length:201 start_codon:yes stop_codon:yes gene_type:complete
MKVIASETLNCKLVVCDDDRVYIGLLGDEGYRQYYVLDPLLSNLEWITGEQSELDTQLELFEGELL